MAHSRGVILRNRAVGPHRYRDEVEYDGGKIKLRRQVRRAEKAAFHREWGHFVRR